MVQEVNKVAGSIEKKLTLQQGRTTSITEHNGNKVKELKILESDEHSVLNNV